jgi:hypothetical protein
MYPPHREQACSYSIRCRTQQLNLAPILLVGTGLPAIAAVHSTWMLIDLTPSLASQFPQGSLKSNPFDYQFC